MILPPKKLKELGFGPEEEFDFDPCVPRTPSPIRYLSAGDLQDALSFNSLDTGAQPYTTVEGERDDSLDLGETNHDKWLYRDFHNREDLRKRQLATIERLKAAGLPLEAQKLEQCGSRAYAFGCSASGCNHIEGRLISCGSRHCVYCLRRRVARSLGRFMPVINNMNRPLFLTLTQWDIVAESIEEARERLMLAFRFLKRSYWWQHSVIGGIYAFEITETNNSKQPGSFGRFYQREARREAASGARRWHAHLHLVVDTHGGFLPLFRADWREKPEGPDWTFNPKKGAWREPEARYIERLEEQLQENEKLARRLRVLPGVIKRSKKPETIERYRAELQHLQEEYPRRCTLTELWYRATKNASIKSGQGEKPAYICWITPLRGENREKAAKEIIKYACKPASLSLAGLREVHDFLTSKKRKLIQPFGALMGLKPKEERVCTCRSCEAEKSLRALGKLDHMAQKTTHAIWKARQSYRAETYMREMQYARDTASQILEILKDATANVWPEKTGGGWGAQALRIKNYTIENWPTNLLQEWGYTAYFDSKTEGAEDEHSKRGG